MHRNGAPQGSKNEGPLKFLLINMQNYFIPAKIRKKAGQREERVILQGSMIKSVNTVLYKQD